MDSVIYEGIQIMVLGMGTVFIFLVIMIVVMGLVSKVVALVNKVFPEKIEEMPSQAKPQSTNNEMLAIAIAVASSKQK